MRASKLLGLAVLLVALAAVMNALAFNTAKVNNPFSITVVNTDSATLAVVPGTADAGAGISFAGGYMQISLADQPQPNSEYVYEAVFTVKNNAGSPVNVVGEWYDGGTKSDLPNGLSVQFTGTTTKSAKSILMGTGSSTPVTLDTGDEALLRMTVSVPSSFGTADLGKAIGRTLRITATK